MNEASKGGAFSPEACRLLTQIRDKRTKYKSDEQDLIKARKKIDEDLKRMGPKRTQERLNSCANYRDVGDGIEMCRCQQKFLADTTDKLIEYAAQGRFVDDGTLEEIQQSLRGEDMPLYEHLVAEVGAAADEDAVGEKDPSKIHGPDKKGPRHAAIGGDDQEPSIIERLLAMGPARWEQPVSVLVQDEPQRILESRGLKVLGNVFWFFRKVGLLTTIGVSREVSEYLHRCVIGDLADGGIKPPPDGMHIEQPAGGKKRGGRKAPAA